jgi:RNA polymerase sigma factor (sigma-70 family)
VLKVEMPIHSLFMSPSAKPCNQLCLERNAALQAAYQRCPSIENRNALVRANLALVWQVARQEAQRTGHCYEDLIQEGSKGLIKAVERFDPMRGHTLATAAVPWIRGEIRHYLRDRAALVSGSHHLLDLHRRGMALQQDRLHKGLALLSETAVAMALGCSQKRWQQALARQQSLQLASLDQAAAGSGEAGITQLEQLPADGSDAYVRAMRFELRRHLWRSLRKLQRQQRRLLLGRLLQEQSWNALGAQCGLSAKAAQRQVQRLLLHLRLELQPLLKA